MSLSLSLVSEIHARAVEVCGRYRRVEAELIEVLQQLDVHRVFIHRGHASLFQYAVSELGLAEAAAYTLISIARKAHEVPELKAQIDRGAITLSNARRIVPVLTRQNQIEWLGKAAALTHRQLEKEIVRVRPEAATPERASYVTPNRVRLELGLAEREMLRLRKAQDLLSQARRRPVSLEETVETLTSEFLRRHDPVAKAKRHQVKRGSIVANPPDDAGEMERDIQKPRALVKTLVMSKYASARRVPLPSPLLHQVNLRDQRKCAHRLANGARCGQTRWLEIHHRVPVSAGGGNTLENLITLCSAHHRLQHLKSSPE